jgi:hypothetical protein
VEELIRQARQPRGAWAKELLIERIGDSAAEVGLAAYEALTKEDADKKRSEYHLAALNSPTAEVRLAGLKGALEATDPAPLRSRLIELLQTKMPRNSSPPSKRSISCCPATRKPSPSPSTARFICCGCGPANCAASAATPCGRADAGVVEHPQDRPRPAQPMACASAPPAPWPMWAMPSQHPLFNDAAP